MIFVCICDHKKWSEDWNIRIMNALILYNYSINHSITGIKSESKKIGHLFCSITQILSILELENINKGQNSLFLALKWGIARLCRSNSFRDTAINVKTLDFYFFSFCKIWLIFYTKLWKFHIIELFLLVISLEPFEVERHTIPHFKAWNKSFWPFFIQKYSEGSQYQIISKRKCPIFFDSDFIKSKNKSRIFLKMSCCVFFG